MPQGASVRYTAAYKFSQRSLHNLSSCKAELQQLMNEVIKQTDCSVICGYRGREAQEKAYNEGHSKARFGQSKHNDYPSSAVDVVPYPLDWSDVGAFQRLGEIIKETANKLGISVAWGGDFTSFKDYPHWELAPKKEPTPEWPHVTDRFNKVN